MAFEIVLPDQAVIFKAHLIISSEKVSALFAIGQTTSIISFLYSSVLQITFIILCPNHSSSTNGFLSL